MIIKKSTSKLVTILDHLKAGDCYFFDIDDTLLLCGEDKYVDTPELTEIALTTRIKSAQERGIRICALTARDPKFSQETIQQFKKVDIEFSAIIFAPSIESNLTIELQKAQKLKAYLESLDTKPMRVIVVDDMQEQLDYIAQQFAAIDIALILYHYQRIEYQLSTREDRFPINLAGYTITHSLGGGTKSTFKLTNPLTGQNLVLKLGVDQEALKLEILCNAIYRVLGVPVPKSQIYNTLPDAVMKRLKKLKFPIRSRHGLFQISEYIEPDASYDLGRLIEEQRQFFVVHALIGNIDVAKEDNFVAGQLVDAGANFLRRAKGESRESVSELVSEIESLRDPAINTKGARWFGSISIAEIKSQLITILKKQNGIDQLLWTIAADLKLDSNLQEKFISTFVLRLENLVMHFAPEARMSAPVDKRAEPNKTAAGVLSWAMVNDEIVILLSKRKKHEWWDNFGGKSASEDEQIVKTAAREVCEESAMQIIYGPHQLSGKTSHDLISTKNDEFFMYRMYIAEHPYIEIDSLKKEILKQSNAEHVDFKWVSVESCIAAIERNELVILEGKSTIAVTTPEGEILPLYPPLYSMLTQSAVLNHLRQLASREQLPATHTQSVIDAIALEVDDFCEKERLRVLTSPTRARAQISETLTRWASGVLPELKTRLKTVRQRIEPTEKAPSSLQQLSHSELHLRVLFGAEYQENNLESNVVKALDKVIMKSSPNLTLDSDKRAQIVIKLMHFMSVDQENSDQISLFHACDELVAFLYEIYSMLHQMMRMNEGWSAFRPTNQPFANFEDVGKLIHHYSNGGTQLIDNNTEKFHEIAVAVNTALFGNHDVMSSNSVHYFLNNITRRRIPMEAILKSLFQTLGVSGGQVERVLRIYNDYFKGTGGVLYRMEMARSELKGLSYLAGCKGKQNPYEGSLDIGDMFEKLEKKYRANQLSQEDEKYVLGCQARVMVPPNKFFGVKKIRFNDLDETRQRIARDKLAEVLGEVVLSILENPDQMSLKNLFDKNTPLLSMQEHLYRQHGLFIPIESSLTLNIIQAFKTQNNSSLGCILSQNPQLINLEIDSKHFNIKLSRKYRVWAYWIAYCGNTPDSLSRFLGNDWLNIIQIDNSKILFDLIFKKTPVEKLYALLTQCNRKKLLQIMTLSCIRELLDLIPKESKWGVLQWFHIEWIQGKVDSRERLDLLGNIIDQLDYIKDKRMFLKNLSVSNRFYLLTSYFSLRDQTFLLDSQFSEKEKCMVNFYSQLQKQNINCQLLEQLSCAVINNDKGEIVRQIDAVIASLAHFNPEYDAIFYPLSHPGYERFIDALSALPPELLLKIHNALVPTALKKTIDRAEFMQMLFVYLQLGSEERVEIQLQKSLYQLGLGLSEIVFLAQKYGFRDPSGQSLREGVNYSVDQLLIFAGVHSAVLKNFCDVLQSFCFPAKDIVLWLVNKHEFVEMVIQHEVILKSFGFHFNALNELSREDDLKYYSMLEEYKSEFQAFGFNVKQLMSFFQKERWRTQEKRITVEVLRDNLTVLLSLGFNASTVMVMTESYNFTHPNFFKELESVFKRLGLTAEHIAKIVEFRTFDPKLLIDAQAALELLSYSRDLKSICTLLSTYRSIEVLEFITQNAPFLVAHHFKPENIVCMVNRSRAGELTSFFQKNSEIFLMLGFDSGRIMNLVYDSERHEKIEVLNAVVESAQKFQILIKRIEYQSEVSLLIDELKGKQKKGQKLILTKKNEVIFRSFFSSLPHIKRTDLEVKRTVSEVEPEEKPSEDKFKAKRGCPGFFDQRKDESRSETPTIKQEGMSVNGEFSANGS